MKFDLRYSALLTLYFILYASLKDFVGPDGVDVLTLLFFVGLILSIPVVLTLCVIFLFRRSFFTIFSILVSPVVAGFAAYVIMQPLNFALPYVKKMQLSGEVKGKGIEHKEWPTNCTNGWAGNGYIFRRAYVYDSSDKIKSDANVRDLGDHFYLYESDQRDCENFGTAR